MRNAIMRGLVIMALATPELAAHRAQASPSEAAGKDDWSLPAMDIASTASAFLEPDPTITWGHERLAQLPPGTGCSSPPGRITAPLRQRGPPVAEDVQNWQLWSFETGYLISLPATRIWQGGSSGLWNASRAA